MPTIQLDSRINAATEIVFDLSRSVDLHQISTSQTNETAIAGVTSGLISMGESVTWRARHFGIYQHLTSKITEYTYPNFFVDEMVSGAFQNFRHEHHFRTNDDGTTQMKDVFMYTSPFGILGKIADVLFLRNYMTKLLRTRNDTIKKYAESDKWKIVL
jgi:ligand-binding SRPBCC domain-containing protein